MKIRERTYEKTTATLKYLGKVQAEKMLSKAFASRAKAHAEVNEDLRYFPAILVSTGANLNYDEFLPEEIFLAQHTIAHKPINIEHETDNIIGHIFSSAIISDEIDKRALAFVSTYDDYHYGTTSSEEDHTHEWTIIMGSDGKLVGGFTSWNNGHRHYISAVDLKEGMTGLDGLASHRHKLLSFSFEGGGEAPKELIDRVSLASAHNEDDPQDGAFNIPQNFDVLAEGFLYAAAREDEVDKIIEEAESGNKFVSMETFFNNYDYRLGDKLVARNKETSFLDKFLRAKKGPGEFNGQKLTRVLRNLIFAGEGVVDVPANPKSEVLLGDKSLAGQNSDGEIEKIEASFIEEAMEKINRNCVITEEVKTNFAKATIEADAAMEDEQNMGAQADDRVVELEKQLKEANEALAKLKEAEGNKAVAALEEEKKALAEQVEKLTTLSAQKDTEVAQAKKAAEEVEAKLAALEEEKAALAKKLADEQAEKRAMARKSDFASFDIDEETRAEVLDEVKALDDEAYAKYLARAKKLWKVKETSEAAAPPFKKKEEKEGEKDKSKDKDKDKKKEKEQASSKEDEDSEVSEASKALASAFENPVDSSFNAGGDDDIEEVSLAFASLFEDTKKEDK